MAEGAITIILPQDLDPAVRDRILGALPEDGVTAAVATAPVEEVAALDAALATAPDLPGAVGGALGALDAVDPGLLATLAVAAAAMAAGYGVERLAMRLIEPRPAARPGAFTALAGLAARWTLARFAGLALFTAAAFAVLRLALPAPALPVADAALAVVLLQRITFTVVLALAAPGAPQRRLAGLDEADAAFVTRAVLLVILVAVPLVLLGRLIALGDPGPDARLARVVVALLSALPPIAFFAIVRRPIAALALKAADGGLLSWFAARWWWFYGLLAVFAGLARAMAQLDLGGYAAAARSGNFSLLVAVLVPFALAGAGAWRDERLAAAPQRRAIIVGVAALLRGAIVLVGASFILNAWGMPLLARPDPEATGFATIVPGLIRAVFVAIVGLALWRAAAEGLGAWDAPARDPSKPLDEDAPGRGASRLATVLPVLRGVSLSAIALLSAMLALSMLGVNITPILAGAGVVGLAIGFGAQRLVQDVISGAFYLYEDAFRVGEYIETGQGKGVVERISLRSVRLRHPRGPVFTVPFAAMGTIQNHSRDWVKVKFTFDVPQDTDLEKVRKLVKKAGEALMADPELEGRFLEPMKSQGAVAIAGQAFSVGVKFVTRPGQQFLARRKAMAALQRTFRENHIELMTPRITLDKAAGPEDIARAMASSAAAS